MKIRITGAAAAVVVSAALVLSGCGSDDASPSASPSASASASEAPTPTAEDVAAVESVEVSGDAGKAPTVKFTAPLTVSTATVHVVSDGDGAEFEDGQSLTIHSVVYSGADASQLGDTYADDSAESVLLNENVIIPQLYEALSGKHVGARFVFANPTQDASGNAVTYVTVGEVTDARTVPTRAEGEAVTPAEGLPTVTLDDSGKPSIEIPEGYEAPDELVVQPLIKGSGPEVAADQTVTVQYSGWLLDGTQFDSSWERGAPTSFGLDQVIQGWTDGLAGQTVGSQVLLVVPADQAYGDQASGTIPANSPLIFVVDILDAQ
ncbi:FKBP-type peptidyl-prolyl cis-trans isomerase [Puerhibacterium puerhi]|uniref:FKBP-type peptidyl-prolyl cis-trans isomerase n=1 Tax=Puerhibacterium puerhi TaxID=2692623 RepID=UPI001356FC5C|nr:FKBP-type peptidyl-prolyl cis-trans isomerase [Puerhibacterium puerhi]